MFVPFFRSQTMAMYTNEHRDGGIASLAMDFIYLDFIYLDIYIFCNFVCHTNQIVYMKISGFKSVKTSTSLL